MNTGEVRDLVKSYLTEFGGSQIGRIPGTIIDNMINIEMQLHFNTIKTQHGYWHTKVIKAMDEYLLPSACYSPYNIKVANERYYPAPYPYIDDAKRTLSGRTRITEDGDMVSAVKDRWYWILGRSLFIYPAPLENTDTAVSGNCTISASTVTVSSGSLGEDNNYRNYIITIGAQDFIILSHDSTTITVDGSPDDTETTYDIYSKGLQIRGVMTPESLTVGGDDDVPGSDLDANCIAIITAYNVALMKRGKDNREIINMNGLLSLYNRMRSRTIKDSRNIHPTTKNYTPFTFRTDHAGAK